MGITSYRTTESVPINYLQVTNQFQLVSETKNKDQTQLEQSRTFRVQKTTKAPITPKLRVTPIQRQ